MYPVFLNLSKTEFNRKIEKLFKILENCEICPRKCHINRLKKSPLGFCQLGALPVVSAYHPHFGEENVLVGEYGSGTIFFSSCNMTCVFCQNYEISQLKIGREISFEKLAEIMLELQNLGCHNINLVSPTSHVPAIVKAVFLARELGLKIPLVYNTNAYDSLRILKILEGIIDIYMPDAKYADNKIALKYSNTPRYFEIMKKAIKEMHRQVGDLIINEKGIAVRGLLVRHLVLPNNLAGTEKIVKFIAKEISPNTFINIMDQYFPYFKAFNYPELSRKIFSKEFERAIDFTQKFGLSRLYK